MGTVAGISRGDGDHQCQCHYYDDNDYDRNGKADTVAAAISVRKVASAAGRNVSLATQRLQQAVFSAGGTAEISRWRKPPDSFP